MDAPAGFRHPSQRQGRSRGAKGSQQEGPTQLFDDTSTQPPPQAQYEGNVGYSAPMGSMAGGSFGGGMAGQQVLNDPMANMAVQYGASLAGQAGHMMEQNVDRFVSMSKLKYYFAVDTTYVGKKLALLCFPFTHQHWAIHYNNQDEPVAPRYEINAPDLYIPIMSFVTYLLVAGYVLGTQNRFDPEQLGVQASSSLIWLIIEIGIILLTLYVMNIPSQIRYLDLIAFCGYKYVGMIIVLLAGLCFRSLGFYIALLYTATCIVFFLVRTLRLLILPEGQPNSVVHGRKRGTYLLLFVAAIQPVFMYWLTSHISTFKDDIN
ncbi:protein YIF1B-A-like isoform X2 [Glandiceps talaboti]